MNNRAAQIGQPDNSGPVYRVVHTYPLPPRLFNKDLIRSTQRAKKEELGLGYINILLTAHTKTATEERSNYFNFFTGLPTRHLSSTLTAQD